MSSGWTRCRELITELIRLPQSIRGGPGFHGPGSDHFDGQHFFNPGASAGRSFAAFLRWQLVRHAVKWPRWRENERVPASPPAPVAGEISLTFINHVTFLIQLPGLNILTDPVYSERASPVQWAGPQRVHAPGLAFERLPPIGAYEPRWFRREQHMNPDDAVRALVDLGADTSVAMHFGCFRLTDEGIDEPALALARACAAHALAPDAFHVPRPGETMLWR